MNRLLLLLAVLLWSCSDDENVAAGSTDGNESPREFLKDVAPFKVGNIVSASRLASPGESDEQFRQVLLNNFNSITAENDMKMANMFVGPGDYDWSDGDAIVAYAKEQGLRVHGHALIWHQSIPSRLNAYSGTDGEFQSMIEDYIKSTVAHFAEEVDTQGQSIVVSWDVVNEYFDGSTPRISLFTERMGTDYHKAVFKWAREADPDVKLFYNDYNIAGNPSKRAAILQLAQDFQANEVPIDGIGMQMHLNHDWPTSDLELAILEVSGTGLLVHVSELDVKVNYHDDIMTLTSARAQAQAIQYQRVAYYYQALVPEEQQFGLTIWGIRDQDSWLYDSGTEWPLLYDNSFRPKPAYQGLKRGLRGQQP